MPHVLITGGAGFIGSHVADALIRRGDRVRVLDLLDTQVHPSGLRPTYLNPDVELIVGDVRSSDLVSRALRGVDAVFHCAAAVGVGQSMYEVARYTSVNALGTAVLLECLSRQRVERLVVASSMSIYGEGLYACEEGIVADAQPRTIERMRRGDWEPYGPLGQPLTPLPTPETKTPTLASVYALSKYDQERLCLMLGQAYGISTLALRFFNVYGPRQALSNPYTGVLAIFASRLMNGNRPLIFEDGLQLRDFVNVGDFAQACLLALDRPGVQDTAINIGSGEAVTVWEIACTLADSLGVDIEAEVTGQYRVGDIRHCFADITKARTMLGYAPRVPLAEGLEQLIAWLAEQEAVDRVDKAHQELRVRGLTV
jgi:dTDP-L-rhamnose 4-epimerase